MCVCVCVCVCVCSALQRKKEESPKPAQSHKLVLVVCIHGWSSQEGGGTFFHERVGQEIKRLCRGQHFFICFFFHIIECVINAQLVNQLDPRANASVVMWRGLINYQTAEVSQVTVGNRVCQFLKQIQS